jgi:methylated-DNA-[protein]-cysteine S-methyltransferase
MGSDMKTTLRLARRVFDTPRGRLVALASVEGLAGLYFDDQLDLPDPALSDEQPGHSLLQRVQHEVEAYFSGRCGRFSVPLAPAATAFQQRARDALLRVPAGATTTYGALARDIGQPQAFRAVAQAMARNPLIIIVPCHRVLAHDGGLGGFSAGLERKRALLAHEAACYGTVQSGRAT